VAALREPSLGPVFGVKGGGTGGGLATLEPSRTSTCTSRATSTPSPRRTTSSRRSSDNALHFRDPVELDPRSVRWRRALDMNDRALRHVVVGMGKGNGPPARRPSTSPRPAR
jgi:formate--tetrahydrofolate ligase